MLLETLTRQLPRLPAYQGQNASHCRQECVNLKTARARSIIFYHSSNSRVVHCVHGLMPYARFGAPRTSTAVTRVSFCQTHLPKTAIFTGRSVRTCQWGENQAPHRHRTHPGSVAHARPPRAQGTIKQACDFFWFLRHPSMNGG